jgi:hypothetical protein
MSWRKPGQLPLLRNERTRWCTVLSVFLKEKQPVLQSSYLQIRNQTIIHLKDNHGPSHADYVYEKNTEPAIIAVVDVVLREKRRAG